MNNDVQGARQGKDWIGVDLDSTLAKYEGWKGPAHIGEPVPRMLARVKQWLREGKDVRIFTARVSSVGRTADEVELNRMIIQNWCVDYIGQVLPVTCCKDSLMIELWDDRAVQVQPNTGVALQDEAYERMSKL